MATLKTPRPKDLAKFASTLTQPTVRCPVAIAGTHILTSHTHLTLVPRSWTPFLLPLGVVLGQSRSGEKASRVLHEPDVDNLFASLLLHIGPGASDVPAVEFAARRQSYRFSACQVVHWTRNVCVEPLRHGGRILPRDGCDSVQATGDSGDFSYKSIGFSDRIRILCLLTFTRITRASRRVVKTAHH